MNELNKVLLDLVTETEQLLQLRGSGSGLTSPAELEGAVLADMAAKAGSIYAMLQCQQYAAVDSAARSILESYADFINLQRWPEDYAFYMRYLSYRHNLKFFNALKDDSTSMYTCLIDSHFKDLGSSLEQEITDLKQSVDSTQQKVAPQFRDRNGRVRGDVVDRLTWASRRSQYDAIYRHLSASSHGLRSTLFRPGSYPKQTVRQVIEALAEATSLLTIEMEKSTKPIEDVMDQYWKALNNSANA